MEANNKKQETEMFIDRNNGHNKIEAPYASLHDKEQYLKCTNIDTIEEFDKWITTQKECTTNVYRGVKEAKYRIQTSAQRAYEIECKMEKQSPTEKGYHNFVEKILSKVKKCKPINEIFNEQKLPINDFLYLALLQHYGYPSPLCDFSYDVRYALFFMLDQLQTPENCAEGITDYCSLYVIDYKNLEFGSIQEINKIGAEKADEWVKDAINKGYNIVGLSPQAKNDFENLPYKSYKKMFYFAVHGSSLGITNIKIPSLGFTAQYDINNPRISAQSGMFIYIGDTFKSLEQSVWDQSKRVQIAVINVHKKLVDTIRQKYLSNLTKTDVYPNDDVSQKIKNALENIDGLCTMEYYRNAKI